MSTMKVYSRVCNKFSASLEELARKGSHILVIKPGGDADSPFAVPGGDLGVSGKAIVQFMQDDRRMGNNGKDKEE